MIIKLPREFKNKIEEKDWDYWTEEEIKNFGEYVYGLSSNDF